MKADSYLVNLNYRQAAYFPLLQSIFADLGVTKVYSTQLVLSKFDLVNRCKALGVTKALVLHPASKPLVFKEFLHGDKSLPDNKWSGSTYLMEGLAVMLGADISLWHSIGYYPMLMRKHIGKFVGVSTKDLVCKFVSAQDYTFVTETNKEQCLKVLSSATLIAIDIETRVLENIRKETITMVGYCALLPNNTHITYIVDWRLPEQLTQETVEFVKTANALPMPKVFHNGTYDNQFFSAWQLPVRNYLLDTEYMFSAIYAELPANLAFVSSFYIPTARYWKNTAGADLAKYNALDCYNTLSVAVMLLNQLLTVDCRFIYNYKRYMAVVPLCIWTSLHGLRVNKTTVAEAKEQAVADLELAKQELNIMCGGVEFNSNSPKQVSYILYDILGATKVKIKGKLGTTSEASLLKLAAQHSIINQFVTRILKVRGERKAISTYYDAPLYNERLLFSYRVDGTKTGRLSCNKSSFRWGKGTADRYGSQVQNLPPYYKKAIIPDEGFTLGELDNSQAEARCVAYLANDTALISALETKADFYNYCGHLFFNLPEEEVPIALRNKVIKRIIHGANYGMRSNTFIDTCTAKVIREARDQLDKSELTISQFATWLLDQYFIAYPKVKIWHRDIAMQLRMGGELKSPLGWVRHFYDDPSNEPTISAAIAHGPQNLNVDIINTAMINLFWLVQVPSNGEFKVLAQVHDSILFQCKTEKKEYYHALARSIMEQDVTHTNGKVMRIPVNGDLADTWKDCH